MITEQNKPTRKIGSPILIVDDNKMALTVLKNALVIGGYEVTATTSAQEAIAIMQTRRHRIVITDWEMPEMDGIELCKAIRNEAFVGYTYIVILTAHGKPEEKVTCLSAGADDLITKPFNPAELLARLQNAERLLSLETRDVAIFALAKLSESRDPDTGAHLERVRNYCRLLAQCLSSHERFNKKITSEFIRLIYQTSPLHDIGKVGIPDKILLKPGRLTEAEFEIMKKHTTIGAETLGAALEHFPGVDFLEMAYDIALTHHERWDGNGYPGKIASEAIPLSGRIMALADVYDALTSQRVYKPAFNHDVARAIIISQSGKQFDPDIVEAFIQTESAFILLLRKFSTASMLAA